MTNSRVRRGNLERQSKSSVNSKLQVQFLVSNVSVSWAFSNTSMAGQLHHSINTGPVPAKLPRSILQQGYIGPKVTTLLPRTAVRTLLPSFKSNYTLMSLKSNAVSLKVTLAKTLVSHSILTTSSSRTKGVASLSLASQTVSASALQARKTRRTV